MSLEARLSVMRTAAESRLPPEKLAIMHGATAFLRQSGALDRVIRPGTAAPDFTLADQDGLPVALGALRRDGPVVLSFFRGFW